MDINFELYKVFYYVATSLSFSEAGRKLYISQSAVSQAIKTLEKKLGQPLFQRSTKRVALTPAGQILLNHIEPAVNLISRGENQLTDSAENGCGQLHIGASDTICRYFLVPYLNQFHKLFPSVSIKVTNATSLGCVELLEQEKVDLIVTHTPNSRLNPIFLQKTIAVFHDVFAANLNTFSQLQQTESCYPLEELSKLPLMILDSQSTTSEFLHRIFLQHNLELLPYIELSSNDLLLDLAEIGLGIAFVPDYCIRNRSSELTVLRTKEKIPHRQLAVAANPSLPLSAAAEQFLELLPSRK